MEKKRVQGHHLHLRHESPKVARRSISVVVTIVAISPPAICSFISIAEAAAVPVSIAVLKRFNGPHPRLITVIGLLQSSHINVPRVIFPPFMLTFAVSIAITILNSVCVGLMRTATVVIVAMIPVSCRGTTAERQGGGE
jgi:hypothetical protein